MTINRVSNVVFDKWPELRTAINSMITAGTYADLADIHKRMTVEADGLRYMPMSPPVL